MEHASAPLAPSGRQTVLTHADQALTVVEVGGGIRSYTVAGDHVVDGYPVDEMCQSGRGQLLLPWPNRLADGSYEVEGMALQTALSEPEHHNAIHGLTRFANWTVTDQTDDRVRMAYRLHPQPGYPFLVDLAVEYHLDDDGLRVTMAAANRGTHTCPYGAGAHPYLRIEPGSGGGLVDDLVLSAPGATYLEADDRGIPVARHPVDGTPFDFRRPRSIGSARMDTGYTDLARGPDHRAVVDLSEPPPGRRRIRLWVDEGFAFLMIFTGDTVPADLRRRGLAVEPMTCAPNAFRSGDGRQLLAPGATTSATWGITTAGFGG